MAGSTTAWRRQREAVLAAADGRCSRCPGAPVVVVRLDPGSAAGLAELDGRQLVELNGRPLRPGVQLAAVCDRCARQHYADKARQENDARRAARRTTEWLW